MNEPLTLLGNRCPETFLVEYWQKQPLLIRDALPGFTSPVSPEELAGLCCEPEVESRLVLEQAGPTPWTVEYGPVAESRFAELPETHWTLLVQECNRYVPELAELREQFNFIPHWRVDDVMASYAPAQGSVGPHTDQYDVFLVQAHGTRRWQISTDPVPGDNFLPDIDLCIMREFTATKEWILHPGDMLYLPPGVAHHGVALEDCITLSVGFRAPGHAELLNSFADHMASRPGAAQRFADPALRLQQHPGEISSDALVQVRDILQKTVNDDATIDQWFGKFITEAKNEHEPEDIETLNEQQFLQTFAETGRLYRDEQIRFAFIANNNALFINGQHYPLSTELAFVAPLLCDQRQWSYTQLQGELTQPGFAKLLTTLYNQAYVYFT
ncbi:MAG: cupin domain-containing protein [Gammaproteobacteria bacterium]|nr:cupin domain-containing protein [Gammaproteobacteria bacterium]